MKQEISHIALVVPDYDEAIAFYTKKLNFTLIEDTAYPGEDYRWVVIAPPGSNGFTLVVAKAKNDEEAAIVGKQAGGRVFIFLKTDDFWRDHKAMVEKGIHFVEEPRVEPYGTVAVFEDLYGNRWDLIESKHD